ncbi:hypothetical protein AMTRI_Chr03g138850 [Amborella trichopoda]
MASLLTLLCFLFLALLPLPHVYAQSYRNMTLGTTLSSSSANNSYWVSPSGDSAFGFYSIGISERTLVWAANRDQPVQNGLTIRLTLYGMLGFMDSLGQQNWIYNRSVSATSASMLDTGNLVLVDSSSSVIWQSFNYPTDTLLPGQTLGQGKALNSTLMDGNYGTGRLMLIMQNDGNLVLYPRDRILPSPDGAYYFTGTAGTQPPVNMLFNTAGAIYLLNSTNDVIDTVSSTVISPIDDYYHRATLDSNGYFRQYSHRKSSSGGQSWTVVSSVPNNINACAVPSICGINSHCILDQNAKIKCLCPDNFSFRDPNNCSGGLWIISNYSMELQDVDWPFGDYEMQVTDEERCKHSCMDDRACDVAIYRGSSCFKKRMPLLDGRQDRTLGVKRGNSSQSLVLVGGFLIGSSLILFLLTMVVIVCNLRKRAGFRWVPISNEPAENNLMSNLLSFKYTHLKDATNGSFGTVYKGVPDFGIQVDIAVKPLDKVAELGEEGIMYLYEECESPIIHCDIKLRNILIDKSNTPKIADFGLTKVLQHGQTRTETLLRGTRGYIICCRRMDLGQDNERRVILSHWVYDCFYEGKVHELVERMVKVGLWCIQDDPSMRPSMKMVTLMLEGIIEVVPLPESITSTWG